jgi:hypothetical protein
MKQILERQLERLVAKMAEPQLYAVLMADMKRERELRAQIKALA